MKYSFYLYIFPVLFVFPTINLFQYFNIDLKQTTLTNISIVLFIIFSFKYKNISTKVYKIIVIFILILLFSELISASSLSIEAINRSFISLLYYFYIIFILFSIFKTFLFFYNRKNKNIIIIMLRNIGYFALVFFYLITLYQYIYHTSPSLLLSDSTLGYRDFRNPLIDNIHDHTVFRGLGSFPEPSMYAGFIVVLLPIMMLFNNKIMKYIIFFLTVLSVLLTYSRIGMLLLFIYIFLLFLHSKKKILYTFLFFIGVSLSIYIDINYYNGVIFWNNIERIITMFSGVTDVSISTRVKAPLVVLEYVDSQILIGFGLGGLIDIFPHLGLSEDFMQFKVPTLNNFYLNFIIEFGLISFLVVSLYLINFFYKLIKYKVNKYFQQEFIMLILLLAYFFQIGHLTMFWMYFLLISSFVINYFNLKELNNANPK